MDELTDAGVVSHPDGENKARKILKTTADLMEMDMPDTSKPDFPKF